MNDQIVNITKANGEREPFNIEKLEHSLVHARASKGAIQKITSHVIQELEEGMTTQQIYKHAFDLLHKIEQGAAVRYSLRRALIDLGPSGFPFERFVAEIFKASGYETIVDQMVKGLCVEHEVDVVAWNDDKLIMSEIKFHNQQDMKSDLKVVLYVKARFDDLMKASFNYGGKDRTLTEGWLVTNTKFTVSALKYAECQNMKIVSWNYPLDGNLQDMIEQAKLHPITCLRSLSEHDKKELLTAGVVLCKTVREDRSILESIHLNEANIEAVLEEIDEIERATKGNV